MARTIPRKLTKSVLSSPTRNAWPYVSRGACTGSGVSLISKPALAVQEAEAEAEARARPSPSAGCGPGTRPAGRRRATTSDLRDDAQDADVAPRRDGRRARSGVPAVIVSAGERRAPGRDAPAPGYQVRPTGTAARRAGRRRSTARSGRGRGRTACPDRGCGRRSRRSCRPAEITSTTQSGSRPRPDSNGSAPQAPSRRAGAGRPGRRSSRPCRPRWPA